MTKKTKFDNITAEAVEDMGADKLAEMGNVLLAKLQGEIGQKLAYWQLMRAKVDAAALKKNAQAEAIARGCRLVDAKGSKIFEADGCTIAIKRPHYGKVNQDSCTAIVAQMESAKLDPRMLFKFTLEPTAAGLKADHIPEAIRKAAAASITSTPGKVAISIVPKVEAVLEAQKMAAE